VYEVSKTINYIYTNSTANYHAPISLGCPKCLSEQGGPWE